ncbi:MAG: DUF2163 domain-containing protein [Pikeienuella sp.]
MRALPPVLADRLATGATTLARAWAVTRIDGVTLGFTDHDRPLAFEGITFEPGTGLTASEIEQATGLSPDTHTVEGALSSAAITELDITRGLFDGAEIRLWLVDWSEPTLRLLLARGSLGEVRRGTRAFEAEVVGLVERLNQPQGRAYLPTCDARLGDARCGVVLDDPTYRSTAVVTARPTPETVEVSGLASFESRWFDHGTLHWTSGANMGSSSRVKSHRVARAVRLTLWSPPAAEIAPGDALDVVAGCDKSADTCRTKFANLLNFRGFPLMPGDDWATSYPNSGEPHDGGSLFRS